MGFHLGSNRHSCLGGIASDSGFLTLAMNEDNLMQRGVIKWFDNKKGFGFIADDSGGQDIFVHFSTIQGEGFKKLDEGDKVEFEVVQSEKGPKATQVNKVE